MPAQISVEDRMASLAPITDALRKEPKWGEQCASPKSQTAKLPNLHAKCTAWSLAPKERGDAVTSVTRSAYRHLDEH